MFAKRRFNNCDQLIHKQDLIALHISFLTNEPAYYGVQISPW